MFEHFIMGISSMPAPFSPGPLSNVSPGTHCPTSYFPPVPARRPSVHRLSSLGGLESALEAMERKPGNEIEKDDVDKTLSPLEGKDIPMFLESEEEDMDIEERGRREAMMRKRNIRGKETRRLAMIEGQLGCGTAQEFVDKVETQQEEVALAFRERLHEIAETSETEELDQPKSPLPLGDSVEVEAAERFEFSRPRRHSVFYPPDMQDLLETPHVRRASLSSNIRHADTQNGGLTAPDASWLKAYNNAIGKAHFVERQNSLGKGGVLHARVQKKICGRRGI